MIKNSEHHRLNGLNHRLDRLKDFTEYNPCHLRNQKKSVIQTKSADILDTIKELI